MSESAFRRNRVDPFLESLKPSTYPMTIQQVSIIGDADKILCCRGRFVWLELKDEGEKPFGLQALKARLVEKAEGIALCASPENWEAVKAFLTALNGGVYDQSLLRRTR